MNIEGTYTLQAPGEEVWRHLMDPQVIRSTIPGLVSFEQIDQNTYAVSLAIQYVSLKGGYHGRVLLSEQQYPYHYRLQIEGEGSHDKFSGSGSVQLHTRADTTIIAYKGTLTTSKLRPGLTESIIKGAVKLFIQQYFLALAQQIQGEHAMSAGAGAAVARNGFSGRSWSRGPSATIQGEEEPAHHGHIDIYSTLSNRIVRLLHLGADDPQQAARWEERLRRLGIVSSLLFLVWLGTRLPRRK